MSRDPAARLLDVHKRLSEVSATADTLPRKVLYLLARESTPDEARQEAIERAERWRGARQRLRTAVHLRNEPYAASQ
jgi:hypothetical protein